MMDVVELREQIIRPALEQIGLWSAAAEELLMGTCAQESKLGHYNTQMGGGPARGIFQMEGFTHDDCWTNYLKYRPVLSHNLMLLAYGHDVKYPVHIPDPDLMMTHHQYAAAMARVKYLRVDEPLPAAHDILGMARYWKKYYNTPNGAGTVAEFSDHYKKYVVA
jgi:hypothetical protein